MSYCQIILLGNCGKSPELRFTPSGKAVCDFSLATNRTWTDRDTNERRQETTWFKVVVWGRDAENVNQYVSKGQQVMVIADRIEANAYLTRDTNEPRASLEVTARQVIFLSGSDASGEDDDDTQGSNNPDIPF